MFRRLFRKLRNDHTDRLRTVMRDLEAAQIMRCADK